MKSFFQPLYALMMIFVFITFAQADDKQLSIYGFRLVESLEEAIDNAVDKGFVVYANEVPEKFRRNSSVNQNKFIGEFFKTCFTTFQKEFGINIDYTESDMEYVDDNLSPIASRNRLPLAMIEVKGLPENANMYIYFVKEENTTKCIYIYIHSNEKALIKDIDSVFRERYGKPEFIPEPEPAYKPNFVSNIQEKMWRESLRKPIEFWHVGDGYAWTKVSQAYLADPKLVSKAFDLTFKELNQIMEEEDKARKEKEDAASRKRKSMM